MRGQQEHDEEKVIQKSELAQEQQEPKNDKRQEPREWQEQLVEQRIRVQEARVEGWRQQEKNRCEEHEDERVQVVPNMEAGSSYLRTTDPRAEVGKV